MNSGRVVLKPNIYPGFQKQVASPNFQNHNYQHDLHDTTCQIIQYPLSDFINEQKMTGRLIPTYLSQQVSLFDSTNNPQKKGRQEIGESIGAKWPIYRKQNIGQMREW